MSLTFKEKFREDRAIHDMKVRKTRSGFLQEGIGIWSKNGKGLYTTEMLDQAQRLGRDLKCGFYCSRAEDPEGQKAYYFCGVDSVPPGSNKKADDGAIVVIKALPLLDEHSVEPRTYRVSPCYAYRVRNAEVEQWSAIIHRKNLDFGFTGICMDPGGGGAWIQPELRKEMQKIHGSMRKVTPIGTLEDQEGMMVMADFILSMFIPRDILIRKTWPDQTSFMQPTNLVDLAHTELCAAFNMGVIALPRSHREFPPEERREWGEEKFWSAYHVSDKKKGIGAQLSQIFLVTDEKGDVMFTKTQKPARMFSSRQRKDFAYAFLYAYMRFLMWCMTPSELLAVPAGDAAMCGG